MLPCKMLLDFKWSGKVANKVGWKVRSNLFSWISWKFNIFSVPRMKRGLLHYHIKTPTTSQQHTLLPKYKVKHSTTQNFIYVHVFRFLKVLQTKLIFMLFYVMLCLHCTLEIEGTFNFWMDKWNRLIFPSRFLKTLEHVWR